jgi:hypothetical protein
MNQARHLLNGELDERQWSDLREELGLVW